MTRWKDRLWDLLDVFAVRRLTARVTLGAGILGLAAGAAPSDEGPRVPVSPALSPDPKVRRFNGRYVLRRNANSFFMHLAGHRSHSSHSSHSSHRSHSSHSSSSHYSGAHASHYSSSTIPVLPTPPPEPAPRPEPPPETTTVIEPAVIPQRQPARTRAPQRVIEQKPSPPAPKWHEGVILTDSSTHNRAVKARHTGGTFTIVPRRGASAEHFNGYYSLGAFDLAASPFSVELRSAAAGTTLFGAARDANNWYGFRVEGGALHLESHESGRVSAKAIPYSPKNHRFLRLRLSNVARVVVWETSADGKRWTLHYVATPLSPTNYLTVAMSAGTTSPEAIPGQAVFAHVKPEPGS